MRPDACSPVAADRVAARAARSRSRQSCGPSAHEEIFREARESCASRSRSCRTLVQRKFFYIFACRSCFSHYVVAFFLFSHALSAAARRLAWLLDQFLRCRRDCECLLEPLRATTCGHQVGTAGCGRQGGSHRGRVVSGRLSRGDTAPGARRAASASAPDAARPSTCCRAFPAARARRAAARPDGLPFALLEWVRRAVLGEPLLADLAQVRRADRARTCVTFGRRALRSARRGHQRG